MNAAAADCQSAKGKINNNAQLGNDTLGVVALNLDGQKLKCGLFGEFQSDVPGQVNYHHTIVCNDDTFPDPQAQLTFATFFTSKQETGDCTQGPIEHSFYFTEFSYPIAETGRGLFAEIARGELYIEGEFSCSGGIVMKFEGEICE